MRLLGIDYGDKRVGIAISDKTNTIASPLKILANDESLLDEIGNIIKEYEIKEVVLGLPKNMNNTIGEKAKIVKSFGDFLTQKLNIKINYVDERLTSIQAGNMLISGEVSRKRRKQLVDKVAASLILETYLKTKRGIK